ncbi:hypothetical protein NG54_02115 [Heyndrickxia ginsengihumi]|uniref:DUF4181 domain-containing protein n=1 Tax=Heyndrickxia ginsengihumi TaxID=363870 RepID=A0A0A6VED5_9BACI|nr:hypothetical protein NG54_02115 [Heyndrickxia ginsengihumi]
MPFYLIIDLCLVLVILISGILVFKRSLAVEASEDQEKNISYLKKEILDDKGLISMFIVSWVCIYVSQKAVFELDYIYHAILISAGVQSIFFLVNEKLLNSKLYVKLFCVIILSFLYGFII